MHNYFEIAYWDNAICVQTARNIGKIGIFLRCYSWYAVEKPVETVHNSMNIMSNIQWFCGWICNGKCPKTFSKSLLHEHFCNLVYIMTGASNTRNGCRVLWKTFLFLWKTAKCGDDRGEDGRWKRIQGCQNRKTKISISPRIPRRATAGPRSRTP